LRHGRPALSIVVTASGTQPHLLRATLESARNQQTPLLEILVACVGAQATATATEVAGDDTRVRILEASSVLAARQLGVRRARGALLVLASPGDVYLPGAVAAALDLAGRSTTVLVLAAAGEQAGSANLGDMPGMAGDVRLGRLVLSHVDAGVLEDADPDGVPAAVSLLRAGFALTDRPSYRNDRDVPAPPHSARVDPLPGLGARIARDRAALHALEGLDSARSHFAAPALAALRPFLEAAEIATPEEWAALAGHAGDLWAVAGERRDVLDVVPRAMARLAALDRRDDLLALVNSRRFSGADFPTEVEGGEVYADLGVGLDAAELRLSERETTLRAQVRRLVVRDDRLVLELLVGVRHLDQRDPPEVTAQLEDGGRVVALDAVVAADPAVDEWMGEAEHDHSNGLVSLSCGSEELAPGSWRIGIDWQTHGLVRRGLVDELDHRGSAARRPVTVGDLGVQLHDGVDGVILQVGPRPADEEPDVEAAEVDATGVHLVVRDAEAVWLEGEGGRTGAVRQHGNTWAVPLTQDVWGLGERPLPTGGYRLLVERGAACAPAVLAPSLLDVVPQELRTDHHRVRLLRGAGDSAVLRLDPLLADDETGPRRQRVLQSAYLAIDEPLDDRLVYFQSFTGEWANDHPLAIQQELARRRPDLHVVWAVADSSATVPAGADPVLYRSRAWYDALARARHVVTNIELERWFRRRPGQQILQTFHGYPSKTMGLGLWRARGLLPSHVEQQLDHTSRTWNALLTPHPDMDRHYREEYAYDGRILALGYPRDDVLVGPDAKRIRSDTRHRLGIAPGQRAVLYAPTWRDDLATNFRAARDPHHLDAEQAAATLGDDYVLLLRGHRFHASRATTGSRVLDVTAYPDVNDLVLAADAAVLDYSSLRFDFALTGRPMVFLVPDLDSYDSRTRGFLWDFGETAPGPWVHDTAGVVAELRDLDALATRWAGPIAAFNTRYNELNDGHAAERVVEAFFADLPALSGP
jgi:CDP-glycerol glycerophosphotransferase (TagB/SpsB family)